MNAMSRVCQCELKNHLSVYFWLSAAQFQKFWVKLSSKCVKSYSMSYYFKLSKKPGQLPYNCHSYPVYIEADSDILDVFKKGATKGCF